MKVIKAGEAKHSFDALIEAVQLEPVLITKRNLAVGVFLSMDKVESIPELKNKLPNLRVGKVKNPLLAMLGANSQDRTFVSPLEIDTYIDELRK